MKKLISFFLSVFLVVSLALPSLAANDKFKIAMPEGFVEEKNEEGHRRWQNEKTGSSVTFAYAENTGKKYYLGAGESEKKEFVDNYMKSVEELLEKSQGSSDYVVTVSAPEYKEVNFKAVSGFQIQSQATRKMKSNGKTSSFEYDAYFFSTADQIVQIECFVYDKKDAKAIENMLNGFELDGELLTAENVGNYYPSPLTLLIPLAVAAVVVVLVVVSKKSRKKAKKDKIDS